MDPLLTLANHHLLGELIMEFVNTILKRNGKPIDVGIEILTSIDRQNVKKCNHIVVFFAGE